MNLTQGCKKQLTNLSCHTLTAKNIMETLILIRKENSSLINMQNVIHANGLFSSIQRQGMCAPVLLMSQKIKLKIKSHKSWDQTWSRTDLLYFLFTLQECSKTQKQRSIPQKMRKNTSTCGPSVFQTWEKICWNFLTSKCHMMLMFQDFPMITKN